MTEYEIIDQNQDDNKSKKIETNENSDTSNHNENCESKTSDEVRKKSELDLQITDTIMENVLKLLYQLIIQNADKLIIDYHAKLFVYNYCNDSDIVTIIRSLHEFSVHSTENENISCFSKEMIDFIYRELEDKCGFNGRDLIVSSIDRFYNQEKNLLELVDSFIKSDISNGIFQLNESQATFQYLKGVKTEKLPSLVYKIKNNDENDCNQKLIEFSRRPGSIVLNSPRNIIIISKYQELKNFEHGVLLHRDFHDDNDDLAVDSYSTIYKSFNYLFFNSLFEAYWNDRSLTDDFIRCYGSTEQDDNISSLFHITKYNNKCYLTFCPRDKYVSELTIKTIEKCFILLSVFPNSIIFKNENPLCVVDFIGQTNLNSYTTKIYLIDENDQEVPIPYPLNRTTLDFAFQNVLKLDIDNPPIRFSITGESLYYKEYKGHDIEKSFRNPNVSCKINSVFHPHYQSHIVLLIDKNFPDRPKNVSPLPWICESEKIFESFGKSEIRNETNDIFNNHRILNISSQILNGIGSIERSFDAFFISLSGGYPVVLDGSVPEYIQGLVEFSSLEGNSVKRGIYHLIKHFCKGFVRNQVLTEPIQLKKISSTNHWKNYPSDEKTLENILNDICTAIINHFHIDKKNVNAQFIGHSLILLQIKGLPEMSVCHPVNKDIWTEYLPCDADETIKNILNQIENIDLNVTDVFHEQTIKVKIFHKKSFDIEKEDFINRVNKISDMLGFLKIDISNYINNINKEENKINDINGFIEIQLIGYLAGIAFTSTINDEFSNLQKLEHNNSSYKKIEAIQQLFVMNYYDDNLIENKMNISIFPTTNNASMKEMLQGVNNVNKYSMCLSVCDEQQKYLPNSLYVYYVYNWIRLYAICKDCNIETFKSIDDLQNVINPQTNMIDRKKMKNIYNLLPSFVYVNSDTYEEDENEDSNVQQICEAFNSKIPFGQCVWTLMISDELISHYIKMWFTLNINVIIRISHRYFIYCLLHDDIIYKTPKDGKDFICPKCSLIYHSKCHNWHFQNDECPILKENEKHCPNCYTITEKLSGCSHMICRCQKHFCFACEQSPIFENAFLCYEHMKKEHNENYFFIRVAIHIYLNQQNQIEKLEEDCLLLNTYIPNDLRLIIHDHQNGEKLKIASYDKKNVLYNIFFNHPMIIESTYEYDEVVIDKESIPCDKKYLSIVFDYEMKE